MKKVLLAFFLGFLIQVPAASALNYKVRVHYPYGTQDPPWKDTSYDTSQGGRENPIELKQSAFKCFTDAFDTGIGDKQFGIRIICRDKEGRTIRSLGSCTEGMKLTSGDNITVSVEEAPPAPTMNVKWEHQIGLECEPGQPTVIEELSSLVSRKKAGKSKTK